MQPFRFTRELPLDSSSDTTDSLQELQICHDHDKYGSDGESVADDDDEFLDDNDYDWFKKAAEEDEKLVSNPKLLDYICNNDKKEKEVKKTNSFDHEGTGVGQAYRSHIRNLLFPENPSFLDFILGEIPEETSTTSSIIDTSDNVSDDSETSANS
ncbi:uncharacterized protein LOC119684546 isoform X2 [Teleopsis dalmanni]|uniref:uncharacterized protein LOC119684546 isoform X2 n=1 Tax=Teleopsis dalmanni TaxID=139649 RepID=UPI0018CFE3EE|nr:uncharacterized protein LOC119684546 isoform X2 [Teleopsis dalmanni]